MATEFIVESCVRGYHYYQNIWDPVINEALTCAREDSNPHDRYAVAVYKDTRVVGHVARKISTMAYLFLRKGGAISCVVTGTRRYSHDLPQGGMEIPCLLKFRGNNNILQKIKQLLQRDKDEDINAEVPVKEPPAKIFKPELSSTSSKTIFHTNGDIWVRCHRGVLSNSDKGILQNGDELSDKHIQFAQKLIKEQFPHISELCSTFLQDRCYNFSQNSVQIIHCIQRHHWIAASNIGCLCNSVNVYDSLFNDLDAATYRLINNMFGGNDECKISMRKVQVQAGINDCGVFAIAFITSLVHGEQPCDVLYQQEDLRHHLIDCFEKLIMTPFPKQSH